jgi:AraC family transcriptional regulator of adaptative response/methylated-DNA-[protein]-cysteine methyltransferase
MISFDAAYAASERRDATYDGAFVLAVATTGIFCKPSCPARMPKRENVRLFVGGEEARAAGYRACKRCRPA